MKAAAGDPMKYIAQLEADLAKAQEANAGIRKDERRRCVSFVRQMAQGSRSSAKTHTSETLKRALIFSAEEYEELARILSNVEFDYSKETE